MEICIKIKDKVYYSLKEFASEMYLYPDEAFCVIKSQKFLKILYKCNEKMYNIIAELLQTPFQIDALVFKVSYILNPLMEIKHHHYVFKDFKALGAKILSFAPDVDIYLKDFLKYHLLSFYMEVTKYDVKEMLIYQKVKELEQEFLVNENRAYFKLGFLLEGSKSIVYNDKRFFSPKRLMAYAIQPVYITDFASSFLKSQYVLAWLSYLGYDKEISLFENYLNVIEVKEKKNDNIRKI